MKEASQEEDSRMCEKNRREKNDQDLAREKGPVCRYVCLPLIGNWIFSCFAWEQAEFRTRSTIREL